MVGLKSSFVYLFGERLKQVNHCDQNVQES